MMSRPARYSAAVAGSSGCAGGELAVSSARTAVSVMRDLLGYSSAMIEPTRSPRPGSRLTSQIE